MVLNKERMLSMYEAEIKSMKKDLEVVKSRFSKEAIQKELNVIFGQYEFSKKIN